MDVAPTQDQRAALRELAEEAQELGMGYEVTDQIRRIPLPPERDPIAKAWQFPLDTPLNKDAEIARLTEELADERAVTETQRSELQDRV